MGLGLFIVLSLTSLGLVIWHEATDGETVGALSALLSVLERMAAVLVTLSLSIYASVEGAAMLYEKYAKRRLHRKAWRKGERRWRWSGAHGWNAATRPLPRANGSTSPLPTRKHSTDNSPFGHYHRRRRRRLWHRSSPESSRWATVESYPERRGSPGCNRVKERWPLAAPSAPEDVEVPSDCTLTSILLVRSSTLA